MPMGHTVLKTRMTELLGIRYPIQCGTMQWLSRAELVAAVANGGGFACLAAATFPDHQALAAEIIKTRKLTQKPFGVNISLFPTLKPLTIIDLIQTVADSGVRILETAGHNPEPYRGKIIDSKLIHIHKCARLKDAVKMDRMGVDAIAVVGTESGGHPGLAGVTTMVLAPLAAEAVKAPLIVGGGICDGRSLMAALSLGAEGVVMGTRFLCTRECIAHAAVKERLLTAEATDTTLILESFRNPGRVLKNLWVEKIIEAESSCGSFDDIASLVNGEISRNGWMDGKLDEGIFSCGQVVGRIHDLPSVAELIERIVGEAVKVHRRISGIMQGEC